MTLRAFAVLAALSGCASYTALAPDERHAIEVDLSGKDADAYLKVSFYVTPFFGDASKKLLSPLPPDEVRLLNEPNGTPVNPGPAERVVPAGTRARVLRVEFPTSWVVAGRIPYTPRTQPWLYVSLDGQSSDLPFVLVLRPEIKSRDEFLAEVNRYLVHEDLQSTLAQWSDAVRAAVREKTTVVDMPERALEMAWGYPELKQITYDGSVKKEKWVYPGEKRVALLSDGRLATVQDAH